MTMGREDWDRDARLELERENLLDDLEAYALEHYADGWDVIVETFTREDLEARLGRIRTLPAAIRALRPVVDVANDRRPVAGWDY